jgi:glycosyltransferase involved in cell wall biosynthesis
MWRIAGVYAFPSRHESYGLTLGEALAEGVAAVAFDRAGGGEILAGGAGVVVEPGRGAAERFARETVSLLRDRPRAERFGERGQQWAEQRPFARAAAAIAALAG